MIKSHRLVCILMVYSFAGLAACQEVNPPASQALSKDQQLIVAAFELEVERVKSLLSDGVNVNARMGEHPDDLFLDKWSGGWPVASSKWTPLLALANSHREPQPRKQVKNTVDALDTARKSRMAIDPKLIAERNVRRLAIAKLLIDAKADLDLDDGYGDTALAQSVYVHYDDLALLLIEAGANVNTKTGVYIDGTGDITPLHRASDRPELVKALLKRGADPKARDDSGNTPLHWAARDAEVESVRLLIEAGADVNVKDKKGRTPLSRVDYADLPAELAKDSKFAEALNKLVLDRDEKRAIAELLRKAGAK